MKKYSICSSPSLSILSQTLTRLRDQVSHKSGTIDGSPAQGLGWNPLGTILRPCL